MEIKKYKDEIRQRALQDAKNFLGSKGDFVKLLIQILLIAIAVALLVMLGYFGIFRGNEEIYDVIFNVILGLFIGDVALLILLYASIPIVARYNMWKIAAVRDLELQKDLKEQKDFVAYLKDLERKANGDLIEINKVQDANWAGVEIFNGEKGNPFHGRLLVIEVTGHIIRNPIEVINSDTRQPTFETQSGQRSTMQLVRWGSSVPSLASFASRNINFVEQGEYTIRTVMSGHFNSSFSTTVEIRNNWKFIVNKDNKCSLEKISEERVNDTQ